VKLLNVMDEFTRERRASSSHSIDADHVVGRLARPTTEPGRPPGFVRSDNGPEFVSHAGRLV